MEPFECRGIWWTPDSPSTRVAGTLRFSRKEGLVLSLLGTLGRDSSLVGTKTLPLILGESYDSRLGHSITLKGCWLKGYTVGMPGFSKEDYHADRAFFGAHLAAPPDFLFSNCNMGTSGLPGWAHHLSGFQLDTASGPPGDGPWFTLRYTPPPPFEARVPGGQVTLYFGAGYSSKVRTFSFKEEVSFSVGCGAPLPEEEWNGRYVYPLLNFMTFVTDTPNSLESLRFSRVERLSASVEVVGAETYGEANGEGGPAPHRMLFSLEDLGDRFGAILGRWFEVFGHFHEACGLFFAIQYGPPTSPEVRLLMLMQALELYQRTRGASSAGNPTPPADPLAGMPEALRAACRQWLAGQGVDTFRGTLEELFDEHRTILEPLVSADKAAFLATATELRNYAIHHTVDAAKFPDLGRSAYLLAETLGVLIKACLLKELGFSDEERMGIFQKHMMYGFIRGEYEKLAGGG